MDKDIQDMLNDLPNKKFAKLTDKNLERLQNLWSINKSKNIYDSESQSKRSLGKKKPEGFGENVSKSNKKRKYSDNTIKKMSESASQRKKPIEKTLENPKSKLILKLLKESIGVNEIVRQVKCSHGLFYKVKKYYEDNINNIS